MDTYTSLQKAQFELEGRLNWQAGLRWWWVFYSVIDIVVLEVVMALADTEDSGIVVAGFQISKLRYADDLDIMTDEQSELQKQVISFMKPVQDLVWWSVAVRQKPNVSRDRSRNVWSVLMEKILTKLNNSPTWVVCFYVIM